MHKAESNTKMDVSQTNPLEECLLALKDHCTTPEKALQLLASPCFSPEGYSKGDNMPVVLFLAYMRFIVMRCPGTFVNGIWEEIFKKTVMYSQNCSDSGNEITQVRRIFKTKVPDNAFEESDWLNRALTYQRNCPNPYTRLELFRLIRIFRESWKDIYWGCISAAFIHTISITHPHHLRSNGDVDTTLFGFLDFKYIIDMCFEHGKMITIISESRWELSSGYSKELRFISHSFQLIGIFATSASLLPDSKTQLYRIKAVCLLFCKIGRRLYTSWKQFLNVLACPCVIETICDITAAIINNKQGDNKKAKTAKLRDEIVCRLKNLSKPCDLPKLLLSRQLQNSVLIPQFTLLRFQPHQTQASMLVRQHTLLITNLQQLYKNSDAVNSNDNGDYEDSDDEDINEEENEEEVDEEEIDEAIYEEIDDVVIETDDSEFGDSEDGDSIENDPFSDF